MSKEEYYDFFEESPQIKINVDLFEPQDQEGDEKDLIKSTKEGIQGVDDYGDEQKPAEQIRKAISMVKTKPIRRFKKRIEKDAKKIFVRVSSKRAQKGNKNFVKFLIKSLYRHFKDFGSFQGSQEHEKKLSLLKEQIYSEGPKKINRKHLSLLIGNGEEESQFQKKNREIIYAIYGWRKVIKEDIFESAFIKHKRDKKQQLLATKVFRHRCRHKALINRLQTR